MKTLSMFLVFVVTTNYKSGATQISGGIRAKRDQFPFFAQFFKAKSSPNGTFTNESSLCGGTLINPEWLLSSARCFPTTGKGSVKPDILMLFMATNQLFDLMKGDTRAVTEFHVHPEYVLEKNSEGTVTKSINDIGIAKLKIPYNLSIHIDVINFPPSKLSRCKSGTVIGVGMDKFHPPEQDQFVKYAEINLKNQNKLKIKFPASNTLFFAETPFNNGKEYLGDPGGPFVCYLGTSAVLYGVTSWVVNDSDRKIISAAYEAVDSHLSFILSYVPKVQFYGEERKFETIESRIKVTTSNCGVTLPVLFYFVLVVVFHIVKKFL